jgi:diguanylate cyclase (GGDEF)-like protein/PAS domain S-box-containing protein
LRTTGVRARLSGDARPRKATCLNRSLPMRKPKRAKLGSTDLTPSGQHRERELVARKLTRLNSLYVALGEANEAIMRSRDRDELFREVCRIAVNQGGFRLAILRLMDAATGMARAAVCVGPQGAIAEHPDVLPSINVAEARGAVGTALREGRHEVRNDLAEDPRSGSWRLAKKEGCHSTAAFPFKLEGKVIGALSLYAADTGYFDDTLVDLLVKLVGNLSFALEGLVRDERRRSAEEKLKQSELRFQATFEHAAIGIAHVALDGRITLVNHRLCEILGYDPHELVGRVVMDLSHPDDIDATQAERSSLRADEIETFTKEKRYLRKDGATVWMGLTVSMVRAPDRTPLYEIAVFENITERKRIEEVQRASEARYRALSDLSADSYWEQDEQHRYTQITTSSSSKPILASSSWLGKTRWELGDFGISEKGWREHRETLDRREPFRDLVMKARNAEGKLTYASVSGHPVFDGLGNFKGYRGIARNITASKREEALLALEHTVTRVLAEADSAAGGLKASIRAICETEGWECGRYLGVDERAGVLCLRESWGVQSPVIERFLASSRGVTYAPGVGLAGRVWQSGEPLWLADIGKDTRALQISLIRELGLRGANYFPVIAEGKPIGVLAFNSREVREPEGRLIDAVRVIGSQIGQFLRRELAEDELRRFRIAMDNSEDMILLIDRATMRFVDVNETVCTLLGYSREELLKLGPQDLMAVSREELEKAYDELISNPSLKSGMSAHYRCKNGSMLAFESTRRVLRSGDTYIIVAVSRDIRERIASETALRISNERFNTAVRATSDVIWDLDLITESLWWNENFTKVFGYPREDIDRTVKSWYDATHPDDRVRVEAGMRQLIDSGGESWIDEYRFRRRDGSYAEVLDRGHVIRDSAGKAVRMIGAMEDVTRRKEAEEKMRNQALRQRLIAEFGQQVLASTDLSEALKQAVELVSVTLKAEYCSVLELDTERQQLLCKAVIGWPGEWIGQRTVPVRPGNRVEFILSRREPLVTADYEEKDTRFPSDSPLPQFGVRSSVEVPIFGTAGTLGILSAHARQARRFTEDDLTFLRSIANTLAVAIERKSAEERLTHMAQFDLLTGLPNRHLFSDRLMQSMAQARRSGHPMAVLFIDLDRFKLVNDTRGHSAGDKLLKETAARLNQCVRSGDTVGRFGGDEFGAVLSELGKAGDASVVAQKIIDAFAQPFNLNGHETYVSASVGITLFPADGEEADALITNADAAMYRAKEQGRDNYQYFTREMNERALERMQMEAALRLAIERKELLLYYQPKVDLESGAVCGFEALLRWQHPERGIVSSVDFIPVLEDAGLIVPVGEWVIREVCVQIRAWQKTGLSVPPIAINLSARQFQHKNLEANVRRILRETELEPSLIQFELTESLLMKEPEAAARTLRGLKQAGITISVDDFGTGYSSLAYLKRFPIDALKIDRAFIRDVTNDPEDAAITLAIIGLAHSLKLKVVAEGVETEGQLRFLRAHNCDEMQGYYFAWPMSVSDCTQALREGRRLILSP